MEIMRGRRVIGSDGCVRAGIAVSSTCRGGRVARCDRGSRWCILGPRRSSRRSSGLRLGGDAGSFVGSVGLAVHVHGRNAKLIFDVVLRVDARSAGIYSRVEVRRRGLRRPAVDGYVSSNDDRSV